jgi:iron complex outermembrane receptor protein
MQNIRSVPLKLCVLGVTSVLSWTTFAQQLEEVIVTAERFEANLQEVPMAVTALSAEQLDAYQINSTMDLAKAVPGMVYRKNTGTAGASNVYIRGFGDDESRLTDPTTGLYIDGVFVGRPYGSLIELVDAGSVEVLRGPQGTLYGRNTIAGAIKINSRQRGDAGAKASFTVGNEGYRKLKGYADFALSDSGGISVAGLLEESDGYVDAGVFGKQGSKDVLAFRLAYDQELGNDWNLIFSYDTTKDDSDPTPATVRGTYSTAPTSSMEYIDVTDSDGITLSVSGPIGDWDMSLLYGRRTIENFLDGYIGARYTQLVDQEQDSFELSAHRKFGNVNLTAGLYWMEEQFDFEYDYYGYGLYGATFDQKSDQTAAFVNAKWMLNEKLTVTTGLRSMSEDKNLLVTDRNTLNVAGTSPYTCGFGVGPACAGSLGAHESDNNHFDHKFGVDYKVNDDVMFYFSHSTGSRSAGWSSDNLAPVDQEEMETTELGVRSTFGNHRINVTVFDSVLEGFQTGVSREGAFGRSNADESKFRGVEFEISGNVTENLSYYGFITSLDAEYSSLTAGQAQAFLGSDAAARQASCPGAGGFDETPNIWKNCAYGLDVKGAPELTWSLGLRYALSESIVIDFQGYGASETHNLTANPEFAKTDKYDKYDLSLTYAPPGVKWSAKLWGKNITDQAEVANGTGGLVYMYDPLFYGITVSTGF